MLDLCAAPGGKAVEIASKLNGSGILVANDISVLRTAALVKNLQMAGASNIVVTEVLCIQHAHFLLKKMRK